MLTAHRFAHLEKSQLFPAEGPALVTELNAVLSNLIKLTTSLNDYLSIIVKDKPRVAGTSFPM